MSKNSVFTGDAVVQVSPVVVDSEDDSVVGLGQPVSMTLKDLAALLAPLLESDGGEEDDSEEG